MCFNFQSNISVSHAELATCAGGGNEAQGGRIEDHDRTAPGADKALELRICTEHALNQDRFLPMLGSMMYSEMHLLQRIG